MAEPAQQQTAESPAASDPAADAAPRRLDDKLAGRVWLHIRPVLRQTWLNLRVWLPVLLNPSERERQIRYWARESCEGRTWMIALPARCWFCGKTEGLRTREYRRDVRGFEYPLLILASAAGVALFLMLFNIWAALIALVLGVVVVFVKSWSEDVRLVISTCPEHADELRRPDMVADQGELYVYSPTHQLAEAATAELKAARRQTASTLGQAGGGRGLSMPGAGPAPAGAAKSPPPGGPSAAPKGYAPRTGPIVPDLPPIKLAGDEDEPPPAAPGGSAP